MKTQKITPEDRKQIIARVRAGEKQTDLASEYDVSKGYISQIVKASLPRNTPTTPDTPVTSLADVPLQKLTNRYYELNRLIAEIHAEKEDCRIQAHLLSERLKNDTKQLEETDDPDLQSILKESIIATRSRITWNAKQTQQDRRLIERLAELLDVSNEFVRRGETIPTQSMSP